MAASIMAVASCTTSGDTIACRVEQRWRKARSSGTALKAVVPMLVLVAGAGAIKPHAIREWRRRDIPMRPRHVRELVLLV